MYEVTQDVDITEDVDGKKKTRKRELKGAKIVVLEVKEINGDVRGKLKSGWINIRGLGDRHWTFAKPLQESAPVKDAPSIVKVISQNGACRLAKDQSRGFANGTWYENFFI